MISKLYKFLEKKSKSDNIFFFTEAQFIQISAYSYDLECGYYIYGRYENSIFKKTEEPKKNLKLIQELIVKYLFIPHIICIENVDIDSKLDYTYFKKRINLLKLNEFVKKLLIESGKFCFVIDLENNKERLPTGGPVVTYLKTLKMNKKDKGN